MKAVLNRFQQTRSGQLAIGFLALCLLFRAAIPAGFMPVLTGQGDAGGALVQLCHGDSGSAQLLDMLETTSEPSPSSHPVAKHEQCAFSAFALLAVSDSLTFNFDFILVEAVENLPAHVFKSIVYSSHPARAPPSFATV